MGKFDGILLCTDLDGTLLTEDKRVSDENKRAIEYFKSEGGYFTFITGRITYGARLMLEYVQPNIPIVCFNGAGIYDFDKDELIWGRYLDKDAAKVLEYVESRMDIGIVVCIDDSVRLCKINKWVEKYFMDENPPFEKIDYRNITEPWKKVLMMLDSDDMNKIKKIIADSEFADTYDYTQSSPNYYEILPKGATKGTGLLRLAELTGIDRNKIIAVGDNENDMSMFNIAKIGVAVSNASDDVKAAADIITVSNEQHAIAQIISDLDNNIITV